MLQVIIRGYELEIERSKVKLQDKGIELQKTPEKIKEKPSKRTLLRGR